jgi:hypothetical protein
MLQAVKAVSSALNDFYGTLSDEQKARFEAIGPQRTVQLETLEVAPTAAPRHRRGIPNPEQSFGVCCHHCRAFNASEISERLIGMIMPWDAIPLSNRRPTYSRPARSEMLARHQNHVPQSQQPIHLRIGMSCPRICVTPSSSSVTKNWTSFLRWRTMRQNGEADCRRVLEQNPHRLHAHLTY